MHQPAGGTPLPTTPGGWRTVLADPPWEFRNRGVAGSPNRGPDLHHYESLPLENIKALPVQSVVARDSFLFLWCPAALLPDGLDVIKAWGFRYVTTFPWLKVRLDGQPDASGPGQHMRNVWEPLLFARRGKGRTKDRSQPGIIATKKQQHSRKPEAQYEFIERAAHGPYLELFGRGIARVGWTSWGDEVGDGIVPRGFAVSARANSLSGDNTVRWVPGVPRNAHLKGPDRLAVRDELARRYRNGSSIAALVESTGYSITRVRTLLAEAGVQMRGRGRPRRS